MFPIFCILWCIDILGPCRPWEGPLSSQVWLIPRNSKWLAHEHAFAMQSKQSWVPESKRSISLPLSGFYSTGHYSSTHHPRACTWQELPAQPRACWKLFPQSNPELAQLAYPVLSILSSRKKKQTTQWKLWPIYPPCSFCLLTYLELPVWSCMVWCGFSSWE